MQICIGMTGLVGVSCAFFKNLNLLAHQLVTTTMSRKQHFTQELANTFIVSDWTLDDLLQRLTISLGYTPTWGEPLLKAIQQQFKSDFPNIKAKQLGLFIAEHSLFEAIWNKQHQHLTIRSYCLEAPAPLPAILECDVPLFKNTKELAYWFSLDSLPLSLNRLEGFADTHGFERKSALPHQRHYHYSWKKKHNGTMRLLESPKSNLRMIQRQINTQILQNIPLHSACHGFRKNHSCLTFVQAHCNKRVVIRMDLQRFFTSISLRRIHSIFETIGYSTAVARLLAGLSTNQIPHDVLRNNPKLSYSERKQYSAPHLPQGAPCSPALANLSAYKLDVRLSALMKKIGGEYTRYADDLAFSGDFSQTTIQRLHALIYHIVIDEDFSLNTRKTSVMHHGSRQQLTGLVLNQHANYPRYKYDQLKAILYNCVRFGAASQNKQKHANFKAHLLGRISHVKSINPQRAVRLQRLYEEINWAGYGEE